MPPVGGPSRRWLAARALYRRADALVAVSRPIEERCRSVGAAAARVFRAEGVIDVERFSKPWIGEASFLA